MVISTWFDIGLGLYVPNYVVPVGLDAMLFYFVCLYILQDCSRFLYINVVLPISGEFFIKPMMRSMIFVRY